VPVARCAALRRAACALRATGAAALLRTSCCFCTLCCLLLLLGRAALGAAGAAAPCSLGQRCCRAPPASANCGTTAAATGPSISGFPNFARNVWRGPVPPLVPLWLGALRGGNSKGSLRSLARRSRAPSSARPHTHNQQGRSCSSARAGGRARRQLEGQAAEAGTAVAGTLKAEKRAARALTHTTSRGVLVVARAQEGARAAGTGTKRGRGRAREWFVQEWLLKSARGAARGRGGGIAPSGGLRVAGGRDGGPRAAAAKAAKAKAHERGRAWAGGSGASWRELARACPACAWRGAPSVRLARARTASAARARALACAPSAL
jgi:hypothetical protein